MLLNLTFLFINSKLLDPYIEKNIDQGIRLFLLSVGEIEGFFFWTQCRRYASIDEVFLR